MSLIPKMPFIVSGNVDQGDAALLEREPPGPGLDASTACDDKSECDHHGGDGEGSPEGPPKKREKAKDLVMTAKKRAKDLFHSDETGPIDDGAEAQKDVLDQVSSDPAFNPSLMLDQDPPKLSETESTTVKSGLKSAAKIIVHPRKTISSKATRATASKLSRAQRPFLSTERDKNLVAAHDELDEVTPNGSSTGARSPPNGAAGTSKEADAARHKVKEVDEQTSSLQVAWTLGAHVDRVKVVQAKVPEPRSWNDFVEKTTSGERGRFQWERWLGYQALRHSCRFTARYVDDFEEMPFDMEDLERIIERLILVSSPWQKWLMSIRQIYTWEDPKRTGKWFALFCFLWHTQHIVGFMYASIIYTVLRNKYYPSSVETVRHSLERGVGREAKAQDWGELVDQHGRKEWIEPLLDKVGPQIQLQLGDLADLLEILTNFYRWKAPWKTAETVFLLFCCLLMTLLTDMAYCAKVLSFFAGFWFFLGFPIATRYPQYRYLVSPIRWAVWDIPTDADWSIEFLQRKVLTQKKELDQSQGKYHHIDTEDGDSSGSEYDTPRSSPTRSPPSTEAPYPEEEIFRFRAYQAGKRGHLVISRSCIRFSSRAGRTWSIPYSRFTEMCKVTSDSKVRRATFGIVGGGLQFSAIDAQGVQMDETITVHQDKRDEIFNLVLGWSGLKWRALCMERRRAKSTEGKMKNLRKAFV